MEEPPLRAVQSGFPVSLTSSGPNVEILAMNRLHIYLFKEVLVSSIMAVSLFVFILLAGNILRDIAGLVASGRLSLVVFAQLTALLIPYVVAYALPLGLLTGIMVAFGRLSSSQELVAMRSAGLSLYYLAAPVLALAGMGVILALSFNFYYTPVARTQYKEILAKVVQDNPVNFLQPRIFIKDFPGYVLYIGEREGNSLRDFWIWELNKDRKVERFVRAQEGTLDYQPEEAALVLRLLNGTGELRKADDLEDLRDPEMPQVYFRELPIRLPLDSILGRAAVRQKLSMLNINELFQTWNSLRMNPERSADIKYQQLRVQMQIQENFAMGLSVMSLCLVAIPLAIKVGRRETYANFAFALTLALTFYFMMVIVSWLESKPDWRPDLLVWLPNLIFQGAGLVLMARANRR